MALERIGFILPKRERKRVNVFYELCAFYASVWNASSDKKVTPQRFMRDCKANRRAYELAQIDYNELLGQLNLQFPQQKAKLLFGRLKNRKEQLNADIPRP
jgi:hypothetical protein